MRDPQSEELIDQLAEISEEGTGFHATAWSSQFIATEEEPQFRGGIIGSPKPVTSPVLKQLVRLGAKALPELIAHLSDDRETRLVIRGEDSMTMWRSFSDEYDARYRDPRKQPGGVYSGRGGSGWHDRSFDTYTLRIGDLCYVVIGQIVNRRLLSLRYQPTGGQIVNSPIQSPALTHAVAADWSGVDEIEHQNSLAKDAFYKEETVSAEGVSRLLYYYPQVGEEIALKLLQRPIGNESLVFQFVKVQLSAMDDPQDWIAAIQAFRERYGNALADWIPYQLHCRYFGDGRDEHAFQLPIAEKIFSELYPHIDPFFPTEFVNAASLHEQIRLVRRIKNHAPDTVLQAIEELFLAATSASKNGEGDSWEFYGNGEFLDSCGGLCWYDDLALSCMAALEHRGNRQMFAEFCRQRIKSIETESTYPPESYRLDQLRTAYERFRPDC